MQLQSVVLNRGHTAAPERGGMGALGGVGRGSGRWGRIRVSGDANSSHTGPTNSQSRSLFKELPARFVRERAGRLVAGSSLKQPLGGWGGQRAVGADPGSAETLLQWGELAEHVRGDATRAEGLYRWLSPPRCCLGFKDMLCVRGKRIYLACQAQAVLNCICLV